MKRKLTLLIIGGALITIAFTTGCADAPRPVAHVLPAVQTFTLPADADPRDYGAKMTWHCDSGTGTGSGTNNVLTTNQFSNARFEWQAKMPVLGPPVPTPNPFARQVAPAPRPFFVDLFPELPPPPAPPAFPAMPSPPNVPKATP